VITPNLREASILTGREITSDDDMAAAAAELARTGAKTVVVKGGGRPGVEAVDAVWHDGDVRFLRTPWIETTNNHGTGCTFGATTAALLAQGVPVQDALDFAKLYVQEALGRSASWKIGAGHGPLGWPTAKPSAPGGA
jgi:hydroxymethylpyrimidine/phosphomethylpyrimidine kinase